MVKLFMRAAGNKGVILFVTLIILLSLTGMGIAMVTSAYMNATVAKNYKTRLQSFYASDGQMTLLCQEILDSNACNYVPCTAGANLFLNPNFASGMSSWIGQMSSPATGTVTASGGVALIAIGTAGTADWQARIYQVYTTTGATYTVSFDIMKQTAGTKTVKLVVELDASPYTRYLDQQFSVDGTWKNYKATVTVPTGQPCRFGVYAGQDDIDFNVRNAVLVSGTASAQQGAGRDTSTVGIFNVDWEIAPADTLGVNITTTSFMPSAAAKNSFRTPLKQHLEFAGGGLTNPFGDSVDVAVTFYDYHSDRTNPEFEQPSAGLPDGHKGMVAATLDSDRKPVLGPNPFWNYYIKYWFRPWQALAQFGGQIPYYRYNEKKGQPTATTYIWSDGYMKEWGEGSWAGVVPGDTGSAYGKVSADSAFRNIVIDTALKFWHLGGGTYKFEWPGDRWAPLDTKGFGKEYNYTKQCLPEYLDSDHNYSFTMEMKRTFTKTSGLKFIFSGDDDVWLFINNTLVMDLGGRHPILADTVYVDDLGLTDKMEYNFDFFYCERHSPGSNIHIETNMLVYVPQTTNDRRWKRDYGKID
jgi:fibro-slime domain-containing protein